jgi:hypothetical protein
MSVAGEKIARAKERQSFLVVMVLLAVVLGIAVRYQYVSGTEYPVNDGGLFYKMTVDLLENDLELPRYTTYNKTDIPFAYPPLAFYTAALVHLATKISLLKLFRLIPLGLSILTIPAFFYLARKMIKEQVQVVLAVLFFALVPRGFEWFVMGGGVTRALSFLFAVLALGSIWDLFSSDWSWWAILRTVLLSAATVLSHPETGLFVCFGAVMFFIYHRWQWVNIWKSLLVAAGVILLLVPWIWKVYQLHGWEPFIGAGGTGHLLWFEIRYLITLNFDVENAFFLSIYGVLPLIAVLLGRDRLTYLCFILIVLGYELFPRSGPNLLTVFISILASKGLSALLLLIPGKDPGEQDVFQVIRASQRARIAVAFLVVYLFLGSFTYKYILGRDKTHLTDAVVTSFQLLDGYANEDDLILIYPMAGQNRFWWNDYVSEWFPALTDKHNATTVQGSEWFPGQFELMVENYIQLRNCKEIGPVCIKEWELNNNQRVDYLLIDQADDNPNFIHSFVTDDSYQLVYDAGSIVILQHTGQP